MDPVTLAAMGKMLMSAGSVTKPAVSGATGGYAMASSAIDSSNWNVNIGSSGGGFSPSIAAGSVNWALLAALALGALWIVKR